jgi:hypothetical protein
MKSPHFEAEKEGLIKGCEACHGNHGIIRADSDLYTHICQDCHTPDSNAYLTGMRIKTLIDGAWKKYREGKSELEHATIEGLWVFDEELMMEEAQTLLINLRTSKHTINVNEVEEDVAKAVSIVNGVIMTLEHNLVSIRVYKLVLIPVWIFVLGMVFLFYTELKRSNGK